MPALSQAASHWSTGPVQRSYRHSATNRASYLCECCLHGPRKVLFNNEVKRTSEKAELFNSKEDFRLNALNCGLQLRSKELSMMTPFSLKIASKH
jgi:hypothetical protein